MTVGDVVRAIERTGVGAILAKGNIKSAYCMITSPPRGETAPGHDMEGSIISYTSGQSLLAPLDFSKLLQIC